MRQLHILTDCLRRVANSSEFQFDEADLARERQIAALARQLGTLLDEAGNDDGRRHKWDTDHLQVEASLTVDEISEGLELLAASADQRIEELYWAKKIGLGPGSAAANKLRFFYWMTLLAFWKFGLGRQVATSKNFANNPTGPLIAFVETMSQGLPGSSTPGAIEQFVDRHKSKVDRFAHVFMPKLHMHLYRLAHGR